MSGGKPKRHILRRAYENKIWAAFRVEAGRSRSDVGAEMGVAESTLRGWIHEKNIKDHAGILDGAINLSLFELSPGYCKNDIYDPDELQKNIFDRAAELNRFKKGYEPTWSPISFSRNVSSTSSSAPVTPTTCRIDNLYQYPEATLSQISRKRLHSEDYDSDLSSSSSTLEHHQEKKMRIDVDPQYHLVITMRLDNEQPNFTGSETNGKDATTTLDKDHDGE